MYVLVVYFASVPFCALFFLLFCIFMNDFNQREGTRDGGRGFRGGGWGNKRSS